MQVKSLRYPKIALINTKNDDFFGYKLVLDQEKIPYTIEDSIKEEYDLVILPTNHMLTIKKVLTYLNKGGNIISSYNNLDKDQIITSNVHTFVPIGKGVLYYFGFNFGEEVVKTKPYSNSVPRNINSQLLTHVSGLKYIDNSKKGYRLNFKNVVYKLIGPITQIWYWPGPYNSCFCQRVDMDFPLLQFYKKKKIIKNIIKFVKDYTNINFTLFLNHSFPSQNNQLKSLLNDHFNIEFQSHGCNSQIRHRDYCYSLNSLRDDEIFEMILGTVSSRHYTLFAPPCEQVNRYVLECCEQFGINITAGGISKDDLPRKCYMGREYNIFNIPTSTREFIFNEGYPLQYYSNEFRECIKTNSLFCIYFHPCLLLNKKAKKLISDFLCGIVEEKKKGKLWTPFMGELAEWWAMRDKALIQNGELVFKDKKAEDFLKNKLSIIRWQPDKIQKLN